MAEKSHDFQHSDHPTSKIVLPGPGFPEAPLMGRWRSVLLGLLILAGILGLFWQFHAQLNTLESRLVIASSGGERLRAMEQQMEGLRDKLHGLMADSVEIRLKSLDRSIAAGKVSGDDLILFQSLQNDIKTLEAYATAPGSPGLDNASPEHPRYQPAGIVAGATLANGEMLREINRLRTLLYLCLGGLMAAGGAVTVRYWVGSRQNPALGKPPASPPPLLTRRRSSGRH